MSTMIPQVITITLKDYFMVSTYYCFKQTVKVLNNSTLICRCVIVVISNNESATQIALALFPYNALYCDYHYFIFLFSPEVPPGRSDAAWGKKL